MKVLIVEDTEDSRVMLERVLVSGNYDVETAVNGIEALTLARSNPPDIIVSDIMMPEMDGFEFCRRTKADPVLKNIPFVFYTATYTERKDRELAMALGAVRFILKPSIPQDILASIKEVLAESVTDRFQTPPELKVSNDRINSMYKHSVGRKLDKKVIELEKEHEALVKSEEKFRTIVEAMADGVSIIDENLNMQYVNSVIERDFGPFEGKKCYKYFNDLDEPCSFCRSNSVLSGKKAQWEWNCKKSNKVFDVIAVPLSKAGDTMAILEIQRDITDRKDAESKLAEHALHRDMLLDSLPHPAMLVGRDRVIISSNQAAAEFGAFPGKRCWETFTDSQFISDEERVYFEKYGIPLKGTCCSFCQANRCLDTGSSISKSEVEFRGRLWDVNWVPLNDEMYLYYSIDVTEERKRALELERLMLAIKQAAEVIIITDVAGLIQYVNPIFEKVSGYTCKEATGQNPRILKSNEQSDDFYKKMWEILTSGKTWTGRLVNRKKDGTLYTEEASIAPVFNASGSIVNYVAVKRDITREIRLQEQSRQMQKMESVGRLAGGIAHDYNNMLGVILGYVEISIDGMDSSHPLYANLEEIRKAAERSVGVTSQLLAFARKQPFTREILDLNETMAEMLNMLNRLIGENIEIVWKPENDLWRIKVDPSQIDQILANLCINARDAIDGTGRITIETKNVQVSQSYCIDNAAFIPGEYVLLTVSDNGSGMSKETINNIFEPFFTTKDVGKGTGMGLATVYGIVKQNKGFINVYSEPGLGTSFTVYLPRYDGAIKDHRKNIDPAYEDTRGQETILLVEDEPALLTIIKIMLERSGYTVLAASSPVEAICLFENGTPRIDLLITDLILPGMNGKELADKLLTVSPRSRCLFMSGYTSGAISHGGILDEGIHFIQKPFALQDLTTMVRKVLNT
ncbi:MAG: response regulator [Candidatus Sabulitectum sp.]|nr:response regulator [Candidatus Sabulitectum sp.]